MRLYYEVYGSGEPTVFLLPTWSIIHSRHWKMQIPYLARHCRVLTFDGRGNGRSDRPRNPEAYDEREFAADALAVMDATEPSRPCSSGCRSAHSEPSSWLRSIRTASRRRPSSDLRTQAAVSRSPIARRSAGKDELDTDEGWAKYNKHHWLRDYSGFLEFFFSPSSSSRTRRSRSRTVWAGLSRRRHKRL